MAAVLNPICLREICLAFREGPYMGGERADMLSNSYAHMILDALPKTRCGKIMRRELKARALGQDVGDISTLKE